MVKYLLPTICIFLATFATAAAVTAPPPAPAVTAECSTLVYDLMDCMEFLVAGGSETTPDRSCCLGFKKLMEINEECMCYAIDTAYSLGLEINMTRAEALPADCRVASPPISNCHVDTSPSGSPANSPPTRAPTLPPIPVAAPALGRAPTAAPVSSPREAPTDAPVSAPAASPTIGRAPTAGPTRAPVSPAPKSAPTVAPTTAPPSEVAPPPPIEIPEVPEESGAWAISATFSVLQLLVIFIFLF